MHFDDARKRRPELRPHVTVFSVLAVLANREHYGAKQQQALLRVLIEEAQAHPDVRLWRQILLCAFMPMLIGIRARTIQGNHEPGDLDSALAAAFLEVVHSYPLRRPGSIATSLYFDTRKRFYRILRKEQDAWRAQRELIDYARQQNGADESRNFNPFEHSEPSPSPPPDTDELREMRTSLATFDCISADDADLLMATSVERQSIREFMARHGLATGDTKADEQTFQRLKKRRQRARVRLRAALRKRALS